MYFVGHGAAQCAEAFARNVVSDAPTCTLGWYIFEISSTQRRETVCVAIQSFALVCNVQGETR